MLVPEEYRDREQSFLKHRVLEEYLRLWGIKLGSLGRGGKRVRLCYVDGFAGPWGTKDGSFNDTSIALGLKTLEAAASAWKNDGASVEVDAYFVEKKKASFAELQRILAARTGVIRTHAFQGEFGEHVETIRAELGRDPAFIFVDPTGWKGAEMHHIAPLLAERMRDVLVNVMFNHINRFKDDTRQYLRTQMREFFGMKEGDIPPNLDEEGLFALYREQLKSQCRISYAADLAIPHPTIDRTKFRLVVGGNNPAVLEVFRRVEQKVLGVEAAEIREEALVRDHEAKTGQGSLFIFPPPIDSHFESIHDRAVAQAPCDVLNHLAKHGDTKFDRLWPKILESHHVTKTKLAELIWQSHKKGEIAIKNKQPRERSVKDEHILALAKSK